MDHNLSGPHSLWKIILPCFEGGFAACKTWHLYFQEGGGCGIDVMGNKLKSRSAGCESGCNLVVTIPTDDLKPDWP
jgi:hypothetical protein